MSTTIRVVCLMTFLTCAAAVALEDPRPDTFVIDNVIQDPNGGYDIWDHRPPQDDGVLMRGCQFLNGASRNAQVDVRRNLAVGEGDYAVRMEDVTISGTAGPTSDSDTRQFKYGIRFGYSNIPADGNGPVELLRVNISKIGFPYAGYNLYNRDVISYEVGNGPLFIRDSVLKDGSDGVLDMKEAFAARGTRFENSYRILRVRKDSYIEDCALIGPTTINNWAYVWFPDPSVKLYVLDCSFDGQPTIPANRIHMETGVFNPAQIVYLTEPAGLLLDPFIRDCDVPPTAHMVGLESGDIVQGVVEFGPDLTEHPDVRKAKYYLDGAQYGEVYLDPFLWGGPTGDGTSGFDTTTLPNDVYTLSGYITTNNGDIDFAPITFAVDN